MPLGAGRQCKCQQDQIGSGEECGKLEKVWVLVLSRRIQSFSPTPLPPSHCMDKAKTALRLFFSSRQPDCDFWVLLTFSFLFFFWESRSREQCCLKPHLRVKPLHFHLIAFSFSVIMWTYKDGPRRDKSGLKFSKDVHFILGVYGKRDGWPVCQYC